MSSREKTDRDRALPAGPRRRGRGRLFKEEPPASSSPSRPPEPPPPPPLEPPSPPPGPALDLPPASSPHRPPGPAPAASPDAPAPVPLGSFRRPAPVALSAPEPDDAFEAELRKPIACPPVSPVFALDGPVAHLLGAQYRPRAGQVEMARVVRRSLRTCQHAVVEAGTGIGKSFAYLVPILWSGAPAVVSTSNKALMNQLWDKDVPQLRKIAPRPFKAALLKGRGNYVCQLRLRRFRQQGRLPGFGEDLDRVDDALRREPSGDCERMDLPRELAARLTVSNRDCEGQRCPLFGRCFYERAKRAAAEADLVVTNHALLCYNVLLTENRLLMVRPVLVIDEAHRLVDYAVNALTLLLEHDLFWGIVNHRFTREAVEGTDLLSEARECYDVFFEAVRRQRPPDERENGDGPRYASRWALRGEIQEGLALWSALKRVQDELLRIARAGGDAARSGGNAARAGGYAGDADDGELDVLLSQSEEMVGTVEALAREEPADEIRFCELAADAAPQETRAYEVQRRPLVVAEALRRTLFDVWPRVICTSATLGVNQRLGWFRRQVGADPPVRALEATLASPFDYARQMLVYTPPGLEPVYGPDEPAYVERLTQEVRRLLEASRGRALVLCTSRRRMGQLYQRLAPVLEPRYPCYCQGALAQPEIVARFKADGHAVIFATRSFWEGIDIPGEALAMVILDKIPFLSIQDPVVKAQDRLIELRGGNPFVELQLGTAILNLRQGAGRLIRRESDRGVIALLDSRVLTRRYGSQIRRSMPGGCHTRDFEAVAAFLGADED